MTAPSSTVARRFMSRSWRARNSSEPNGGAVAPGEGSDDGSDDPFVGRVVGAVLGGVLVIRSV